MDQGKTIFPHIDRRLFCIRLLLPITDTTQVFEVMQSKLESILHQEKIRETEDDDQHDSADSNSQIGTGSKEET